MAIPSSGTIGLGTIRTELEVPSQAPFSLDVASNGGYGSINPSSPSRPSGANPDGISEWYGYDHNTGWVQFNVNMDSGVTMTSRLYKNGSIVITRTSSGSDFLLYEPGDTFQVIISSRASNTGSTLEIGSNQRGQLYYENKAVGSAGNLTSPTFTLQYREQITVSIQGYL